MTTRLVPALKPGEMPARSTPRSSSIRSICFVRLSALGDVCLALPAIQSLRLALPEAQITWVIDRVSHHLVGNLPGFRFVVLDKSRGLAGYLRTIRELRSTCFDALLAAQASFRAHWLYPFIRARRKIGFDASRSRDGHQWFIRESIPLARVHLADGYFQFAEAIGVSDRMTSTILPISALDRENARKWLPPSETPTLAIHISASNPIRNWPPDRTLQAAQHAVTRWKARIVITGGRAPSELTAADSLQQRLGPHVSVINLVGKTSPLELASVLERVDVLLLPDTGPLHLADAMGTPVIGLFAVIHSGFSGPYKDRRFVIDRFAEAMELCRGRKPRESDWHARIHDRRAMECISVADVTRQLDRVFQLRDQNLSSSVPSHEIREQHWVSQPV